MPFVFAAVLTLSAAAWTFTLRARESPSSPGVAPADPVA
jgi:hypothetical protein